MSMLPTAVPCVCSTLAQVIRKGLESGPVAGYEAEADGFAELGMTSESKALKSLFFGRVSHTHTHTHTHTHSSCQTVGKWHEMHGRMPLSQDLKAIL